MFIDTRQCSADLQVGIGPPAHLKAGATAHACSASRTGAMMRGLAQREALRLMCKQVAESQNYVLRQPAVCRS